MTTTDPRREALEQELEAAFCVDIPALRLEDALARRAAPVAGHRRAGSVAGAGALAAGLVAAVAFLPGYLGGAETVSAQELVNRSAAASALRVTETNYHMVTVHRSAGNESVTESWYGGPDRNRNESRSTFATGETSFSGTAILGDEYWMYNDDDGPLRVAHGPRLFELGVPRTPSLADHIQAWTDDNCFSAEVTGEEQVAGRTAHVVTILATPETCPYEPKPLKKATLWIDAENDMALKMQHEGDRPEDNSSFELRLFETFESLPDSAFVYTPPAGTQVIEFTTREELKGAFIPAVPRGSRVTLTDELVPVATPTASSD